MSRLPIRRSLFAASCLLGLGLLVPATVDAAPGIVIDDVPGLIPNRQDITLVDRAGDVRPLAFVPGDPAATVTSDQRPTQLGAKVLYVNFDGITLNQCGNNSPHQNCSTIFGGTVLPYSGDEGKRASIIQTVRSRVAEFGITITDTRPNSGDYDMEVVGDWQGVDPSFAGIAPAGDCWDNGGGEVSFTLEASGTTDGMAEIILQELAHTWGLDHVDSQQDLLYPTTEGMGKQFLDECLQVVADTDLNPTQGFCSHHQQACGSPSLQNSYQEMLLIFGASVPDTAAPSVQINAPGHGDILDSGDFVLSISLADDQTPAVMGTRIVIDSDVLDEPIETTGAYAGPIDLEFPIMGLPNGDYDITVETSDESDNPASDSVTVRIMGAQMPGDGGDDGGDDGSVDGDGGDGDGGGGNDDGGGADDGDGDGGGADDGEDDGADDGDTDGVGADGGGGGGDGCAIDSQRRGRTGLSLLMLMALLGASVRRRSASA